MRIDIGLLLLRLCFGGLLALSHGLPKLQGWASYALAFPDPLGVGMKFSLGLAIFGELVCGLLVAVGLTTRLAAIPAAITMAVAFAVVHGADPWSKKELAFIYAIGFFVISLAGPGRLSLDALFGAKRKIGQYRP